MNEEYPVIYHIGLMKTGTTSIQNILKADPAINLILKSRYFNTNKYFTEAYPKIYKDLINIESDEVLSRNDGFYGLEESLRRIQEVQPKAKIIVTIREQRSLLLSAYKHHIRQTSDGYTFTEFLHSSSGYNYIKLLNYYNLVNSIEHFFDKSQIHVFMYEDLRADFRRFITDFYMKLFGQDILIRIKDAHLNKGLPDDCISLKKSLNKYRMFNNKNSLGRIEDFLIRWIIKLTSNYTTGKKKIEWPKDKLCLELEEKFRESNVQFMNYMDINIKQHGYLL
ncbi:MAG: sulfotransferase domain-containing protein [Brumimicrobium sp.]